MHYEKNKEEAIHWILYSGIQNNKGTKDVNGNDLVGSFNAWFNLDRKEFSYSYIEITGYALTTLVYLYEITKEKIFLDRALLAGDWLIARQDHSGAFPTAFYHSQQTERKPEEYHTFDVGMVFNGLANLYRTTQDQRYLVAAKVAAKWVIGFQNNNGSIPACIDKKTGRIKDSTKTWSTQPGSYHAKLAIGLLNIYDLTREEVFREAAQKLCDYALHQQKEDGQFCTYGVLNGTNLHPHSYSSEGLYVAGVFLNNEAYLASAIKGTEWALLHMQGDIVPRHKHEEVFNYNERIDVVAQTLRLATLLGVMKDAKIKDATSLMLKYQYFGDIESQRGGFLFGKLNTGEKANHVNSWVTMFALQALVVLEEKSLKNLFHLI